MNKIIKILVIVVLVTIIGVGGYIAWDYTQNTKEAKAESDVVTVDELLEQSIDTEEITTNFADHGYGKMKFKLIAKSKEDAEEIKKLQFRVDSTIIHYINGLEKEKAHGPEGIALIETDLQTELNKQLGEKYITRVYIVDMLIQ